MLVGVILAVSICVLPCLSFSWDMSACYDRNHMSRIISENKNWIYRRLTPLSKIKEGGTFKQHDKDRDIFITYDFFSSPRGPDTGLVSQQVNFTYQFLRRKFHVFSQFLYDEQIKSRLLKDRQLWREVSNYVMIPHLPCCLLPDLNNQTAHSQFKFCCSRSP